VCEPDFAAVGAGPDMVCTKCSGSAAATIIAMIIIPIFGITFLCWWFFFRVASDDDANLGNRAERASSFVQATMDTVDKWSKFWLTSVQAPFKILLSYYQIASGLSFVFGEYKRSTTFLGRMSRCKVR
jgi:hypothetical protein